MSWIALYKQRSFLGYEILEYNWECMYDLTTTDRLKCKIMFLEGSCCTIRTTTGIFGEETTFKTSTSQTTFQTALDVGLSCKGVD